MVTQPLLSGGNTATAFKWTRTSSTSALLFVSIAIDAPSNTSGATASATVQRMTSDGLDSMLAAHRRQWASFWSDFAFISISQPTDSAFRSTVLEGFYFIQQYKLGSSIRKGGPALDLAGPWLEPSGWLFYWMDLNEQLQYWPLYAAGRFDLARTMETLFTRNLAQLSQNVAEEDQHDSMAIGGACPADLSCKSYGTPHKVDPVKGYFGGAMIGCGTWSMCHSGSHNQFFKAGKRGAHFFTKARRHYCTPTQGTNAVLSGGGPDPPLHLGSRHNLYLQARHEGNATMLKDVLFPTWLSHASGGRAQTYLLKTISHPRPVTTLPKPHNTTRHVFTSSRVRLQTNTPYRCNCTT